MFRSSAIGVAIAVVALAACNGDDDAGPTTTTLAPPVTRDAPTLPPDLTTTVPDTVDVEPPASTDPSTTVPGSTTSPSLVTVTTTSDAPPTTQPGEPDWVEVVQGLLNTLVDLQGAPDADRVTEFCFDSDNECQGIQGEAIRQYAEEGWRTLDFPAEVVTAASLADTPDDLPVDDAPFVIVSVTTGPQDFSTTRVVDQNGDLVFNITSPGDGGQALWFMARNDQGEWRVLSINPAAGT